MKFNDCKTFSAYVRSNLHSGYITLLTGRVNHFSGVIQNQSATRLNMTRHESKKTIQFSWRRHFVQWDYSFKGKTF